jgi:hypothetical protein
MASQGGHDDAASLFSSNAKKKGDNSGGIEETLSKLVLAGNLDSAAKAMEGFSGNLQNALSQLTHPIAGIASAFSQHPSSVFGSLKLLGEQSQLNMEAAASEITGGGDESDYGGDQSDSDSGFGDDSSDQGNFKDDDFFEEQSGHQMSEYDPHQDQNLEDAGHKILSGGDVEHDHYEDLEHSLSSQSAVSSSQSQDHGVEAG